MRWQGNGRQRRGTALILAVGVVLSGVVAVAGDAPGGLPPGLDWLDDLQAAAPGSGPLAPPMSGSVSAPPLADRPLAADQVVRPVPWSGEVTLAGERERVTVASGVVGISARAGAARGTRVQVEVTTPDNTALAVRLRPTGTAQGTPVEVTVDYSGFAHAYGGGYADRLRMLALPECALRTPRPADCRAVGVPVEVKNDAKAQRLAVDAAVSTGATVLVLAAGPAGETGNFGATPMAPSADWQVAAGSGEFSWNYDIPLPAPPLGTAPPLGLGYSSGSVDGMVSTRNPQSPQSGVGWSDFIPGFIERRYTPCAETGDLCWESHNASISLNGRSAQMIAVDATREVWRLKADPGWLVEHLHGTVANGDDNREYWKVTTPDGTRYFFGLGASPDTGAATESVWTVPVYADDAGEPCRGAGNTVGVCDQAWRWNLDRVVDRNGVATTYTYLKENNRYLALNGLGNTSSDYTRAGRLAQIEYGKPHGTGTEVSPAGRVIFEAEHRCRDLSASCPAPSPANGDLFPDVPADLICSASCLVPTPTFFSGKRYTAIRTEVRVGGVWRPVSRYELAHGHRPNSDGDAKLYLNGIQRKGLSSGGSITLPPISFLYTELANRVDVNVAAGRRPMGHFRLGLIVDEYGAQTFVTYGQKSVCPASKVGASVRWDLNAQDCFPQKFKDKWATFHKYLTTKVEQVDPLGNAPNQVTTYTYENDPAWHHDDDEFVSGSDQSWSDWRGYATTMIAHGSSSRTRIRTFRGMQGDRLMVGGPRSASVVPFAGSGFDSVAAVPDLPWLAGSTLIEADLNTLGGTIQSTLYEYEARTLLAPGNDPQDWAVWLGGSTTTIATAKGTGGFALQRSTTGYTDLLQPETLYEEGWLDRTGDERCTRTTYANNLTAAYLRSFVASVTRLAGSCASTVELSRAENYYDGSTTLGAPPTKGNPTRQRVKTTASTWVTKAETTYDAWGRPVQLTDARGLVISTAHEATPNGGHPTMTTTTVKAPGGDHVSTVEWLPEHGVPVREVDANGNVTTYAYDALGRLLRVRQPTEQPHATGKPASWEFTYQISPNKSAPPVVKTSQTQSADLSRTLDSWVIYDSFVRERQTHTLSPETGKVIVTATTYDDQGRPMDRTSPQAVAGTPGSGLLQVAWENRTRTGYDAVGRVSREGWLRGGTEQWGVVTTYTHDQTTVLSPGERQTRTTVDGLGRLSRVEEFDGTGWRAATYTYDLADRLTSVTDPAGNVATYTYNLAGWRLTEDSPDGGAWSYGYDAAGAQTRATDARGTAIHTLFDLLGRSVERRRDSVTGPLLARWEYDAVGEKGLLNRSTRFTPQGSWITDVTGYDGRGRVLGKTLTVPAGVPGLTGTYAVGYGYDPANRVTSVSYPAVGGLPAETVTTNFTSIGQPLSLTGATEYVWSAGYDDRARRSVLGLGPRPGGQTWLAQHWTYDVDQRLARVQTVAGGVSTVDHQFGYDEVGNLTSRTTQLGTDSWRECYGYDLRTRLVSAYTTAATSCGSQRGTGPRPYDHTYTYTADGNLTSRVVNGTTVSYGYPSGTGADRPHAPLTAGATGYTWDANGNLVTRTTGGLTDTFSWDAESRLASVAGPGGTTSFLYDTDGTRLMRTTAAGRTLFIEGHEITANTAGTAVTATRTYSLGAEPIATRTPSGVDYLITDQQGSVEATLPSGGALEVTRAYDPYGRVRSGGQPDTDRGWIGQIEDDTTGLNHLNARYHDPVLGRFISPDPIYDLARPQTLNPYAYGLNNPVVNEDPSGLYIPINNNGRRGVYHHKWSEKTKIREIAVAKRAFHSNYRSQPLANVIAQVKSKRDRYAEERTRKLRELRGANADPGFWRMIAAARKACPACTGSQIYNGIYWTHQSILRMEAIQRNSVVAANANAQQFPFHCCYMPEWFSHWILAGNSGPLSDPEVGAYLYSAGNPVKIVIHDVTLVPGIYTVTLGNQTKSVVSLGGGSLPPLEFDGCVCDGHEMGVSWETPISPGWDSPVYIPVYSMDIYLEIDDYRWPQP